MDESEGAQVSPAPDLSAFLVDSQARLEANRRRLERIKARMADNGEARWRELFRASEQVMRAVYANGRVMRDPESSRIIERLRHCRDLEAYHYDLQCLSHRLAEIAGQARPLPSVADAGSQASAVDGKPGTLSVAGRMHLRL